MTADTGGFALMVLRMDGQWQVSPLPTALVDDLDGMVDALRQQQSAQLPMVFADIEDEFFVVLRLDQTGAPRALLSDVTAAADFVLAEDVLDLLGEEVPQELDEIWPAGDLALFADLGLAELELGAILDDLELYADEMLLAVTRRLGFEKEFASAMGMVSN
jgi:putative tRNA adenosine deaminase-associated protein